MKEIHNHLGKVIREVNFNCFANNSRRGNQQEEDEEKKTGHPGLTIRKID